ncbi:MAG: response regulator transcription factor [Alphaproteobacteria bacterium]
MHEKKNKVLVIDNEPQIKKMLSSFLATENFSIEESNSGKQGVRMSASIKPDVILLDLGLPDMNGKDVIAAIREWSQVPIMVLSVCAADEEIIAALEAGADDYVVKPFNVAVLAARIKANLRKAIIRDVGEPELRNGIIRMDLLRHEVFVRDEKISLTPKEYEILHYFMVNRGCMLTHKQILHKVWGPAHGENMHYLRVYVGKVREKLETDPSNPRLMITEPGVGYRMEVMPPEMPEIPEMLGIPEAA